MQEKGKGIDEAYNVITEFIKWIGNTDKRFWFRGHSSSDYQLLPSLYRAENQNVDLKKLLDFESSICGGVESELAFRKRAGLSEWEIYFEARHCEAPSRLLDFTENGIIALFFAVQECTILKNEALIYRFDPLEWNSKYLPEKIESDRRVVHIPDLRVGNFVDAWGYLNELREGPQKINGKEIEIDPKYPIAICPPILNARMKEQQSRFLIFGSMRSPANNVNSDKSLFESFPIPSENKDKIRQILKNIGYTKGVVFQTLDDIVKDLVDIHRSIIN
jgi:hypothetical protein